MILLFSSCFSAFNGMIYLHGGAENEKATVCAEGLYAFTPCKLE